MDTVFIILIGVLSRLMPHWANITAVGGIALFSGSRFGIRKAILITFITMFLSDALLGFHALMWATYGSLFLGILIGRWVGNQTGNWRLFGGIFSSSVIFFLVTNFAVWVATPMYPRTMSGLIDCFIMALPFFRNSLLGDFVYTFVFFKLFSPALSVLRTHSKHLLNYA